MTKMTHFLLACIMTLSGVSECTAQAENRYYEFNTNKSTITWLGRKADQKYTGTMKLKSGYIKFNKNDLEQAVLFADVQSIDCKDCGSQEEAKSIIDFVKSAEFLNVSNMDFATFKLYKATNNEESKEGNYRIEGNLTIIGYSNVITMPITVLEKKDKVYVEGKLSINRSLWKLNNPKNVSADAYMGQTIELFLNLEGDLK